MKSWSSTPVQAPEPGQKVLIVMDKDGQALRWEPYPSAIVARRIG
jgi:hypothetical protein